MFQLPERSVVILAAICFIGSVAMQTWWVRSAYEGELSMYNKEKRAFQSGVEEQIRHSPKLKSSLKNLLHKQNTGTLSVAERQMLLAQATIAVEQARQDKSYSIYPDNYGIASHKHDSSKGNHFQPLVFRKQVIGADMEKAVRLCLHCLLQGSNEDHGASNYELVLLYGHEKSSIYRKMALLLAGSFLFLLCLGLLFRLLLKKYNQQKRLSEAKNDFINNLSHEIQTPVFAVQLANKLIKEKTAGQEALQPLIAVIEKETQQLKQHAGKILELASLENERVELKREATPLNSFIEEKLPTLEIMLQNRQGKIITEYGKGALVADLDRTHFNNVLVSLTENAIKYNDTRPLVTIATGLKDDMIFMDVKDNGIGIEQQYLPYVFDKFYRAPDALNGKAKGFGLGLSYVKQIIQLHGGSVDIKAEKGRGTVVSILLPKSQAHA